MTPRQIVMGVALLAASWLAFWADKTPVDDKLVLVADRAKTQSVQTSDLASTQVKSRQSEARDSRAGTPGGVEILRLRSREPLARVNEDSLPESHFFASGSWEPPPPKAGPAEPPKAPPLPYAYVGKKQEAGVWEIYLALGEDVRVVRPNMTLDGKYQIGSITPPTMNLTYMPLNQTQTLSIGNPE